MAASPTPDPFNYVREWDRLRNIKGWWHSFELPDGTTLAGVSSLEIQKQRIAAFPIPDSLDGKRVLDIGTWDGWFAFEMERRGADVVAVDCWDNSRFREIKSILNSHVDYRLMDMYELTPDRIGKFDIVLFMGVLYHLKHPLLALERVCALTTGFAAVESFILRDEHRPDSSVSSRTYMEFYETDELGGQTDNWCGPTLPCLTALCRTAGFARVELAHIFEFSACVTCHRHWLPSNNDTAPQPVLLAAHHNMNYGINFESRFDEYVTCSFHCGSSDLVVDDVQPEVSGFGTKPIKVERISPEAWRAHFKLPPGLEAGWHEVRVSVRGNRSVNEKRIAVDLHPETEPIVITGVADGQSWKPNELSLGLGDVIVLWVDGLPGNADVNNVKVYVDDVHLSPIYVGAVDGKSAQINARMPSSPPVGSTVITVEGPGRQSASVELVICE